MDIEVRIKVKNIFDTTIKGESSSFNIDNKIIDFHFTELDNIIEHVFNAMVALGYTSETVKKYINISGECEDS